MGHPLSQYRGRPSPKPPLPMQEATPPAAACSHTALTWAWDAHKDGQATVLLPRPARQGIGRQHLLAKDKVLGETGCARARQQVTSHLCNRFRA